MRRSSCLAFAIAAFGLIGCSPRSEPPLPPMPETTVLTYTVGFGQPLVMLDGSSPPRGPVDEEERYHADAASRFKVAGANLDAFDTLCIAQVDLMTFDAMQRIAETGRVEPALSDPASPDQRNAVRWEYLGSGLGPAIAADEAMRSIFFRIVTPDGRAIAFADPPAVRDADGRVYALTPAAFDLADHVALEALVASAGCPELTTYFIRQLDRF